MKTLGIALAVLAGMAVALDVPLVVQEYDGVERIASPVNSGVPLPRSAVKDLVQLRLVDSAGKPVFEVSNRAADGLGTRA